MNSSRMDPQNISQRYEFLEVLFKGIVIMESLHLMGLLFLQKIISVLLPMKHTMEVEM